MRDSHCDCNAIVGFIKNNEKNLYNHYTKEESDSRYPLKSDVLSPENFYTKEESDIRYPFKWEVLTPVYFYTKEDINRIVEEINSAIGGKADQSALQDVADQLTEKADTSALTELSQSVDEKLGSVYTKDEVDEIKSAILRVVDGKADATTLQAVVEQLAEKADASDLIELSQSVDEKFGNVYTKTETETQIKTALETTATVQDIESLFA